MPLCALAVLHHLPHRRLAYIQVRQPLQVLSGHFRARVFVHIQLSCRVLTAMDASNGTTSASSGQSSRFLDAPVVGAPGLLSDASRPRCRGAVCPVLSTALIQGAIPRRISSASPWPAQPPLTRARRSVSYSSIRSAHAPVVVAGHLSPTGVFFCRAQPHARCCVHAPSRRSAPARARPGPSRTLALVRRAPAA